MNVSTIHSKAVFIATLNPKAWEVVGGGPAGPGGPAKRFTFSDAHIELLVADVVRSVGATLADRKLGKKVLDLSHKMATQATQSMLASWEPGDEICPPWRWPWPGPWPIRDLLNQPEPESWKQIGDDPDPVPWKQIDSAEQISLAYVLTQLSGLTMSKEFNQSLKSIATEIATSAAKSVADDFERCGTVPRRPFPKPHGPGGSLLEASPALAARAAGVKVKSE